MEDSMSSTTLLPIGTMVYYKGCKDNPEPDFGWIVEHRFNTQIYCTARDAHVKEPHYLVEWGDGNSYYSTQDELEADEFIILEDTCN